jgi:hypothetical protein
MAYLGCKDAIIQTIQATVSQTSPKRAATTQADVPRNAEAVGKPMRRSSGSARHAGSA